MILILGLNPALDVISQVPDPRWGDVNFARNQAVFPAGKATNLARHLALRGQPVQLLGWIGQHEREWFEAWLEEAGAQVLLEPLAGTTRINFKVIDVAKGADTEFNGPGIPVEPEALSRLEDRLERALPQANLLVLTGSLPPGVPPDLYARWIRIARQAGVPCVLDASGPALQDAAPENPWAIKLNWREVSELAGRPVIDGIAAADVLRQTVARGTAMALATHAERVVLVTAEGEWEARVPPRRAVNPIGAGDALLGGLICAWRQGASPQDLLRQATASAVASVELLEPGGWSPELHARALEEVRVAALPRPG
jgi:1-phosphofructokinase family hexose kinase